MNIATEETKPIIAADKWSDMTLNELLEQKSIMLNRIFALYDMKKDPALLNQGLEKLETLIQTRL